MSARAAVAFITDQVEEVKQRQFVELVPGIVQVRSPVLSLMKQDKRNDQGACLPPVWLGINSQARHDVA